MDFDFTDEQTMLRGLARELLIEITQSEPFAPIYVKLGYAQPV